jgi:hypothetical protein
MTYHARAAAIRHVFASPWRVSLAVLICSLLVLLGVEAFLRFHPRNLPRAAQLPIQQADFVARETNIGDHSRCRLQLGRFLALAARPPRPTSSC